jgi:hypothetical protein
MDLFKEFSLKISERFLEFLGFLNNLQPTKYQQGFENLFFWWELHIKDFECCYDKLITPNKDKK